MKCCVKFSAPEIFSKESQRSINCCVCFQNCCPSRIVPCITLHGNVNGRLKSMHNSRIIYLWNMSVNYRTVLWVTEGLEDPYEKHFRVTEASLCKYLYYYYYYYYTQVSSSSIFTGNFREIQRFLRRLTSHEVYCILHHYDILFALKLLIVPHIAAR